MWLWTGLLAIDGPDSPVPMFEDPSAKGSLVLFDQPRIPYPYQGVWADRPENCYVAADRGEQVSISAGAIGLHRVDEVEGYSDHPAIVVTMREPGNKVRQTSLDISLDQQAIRIGGRTRDASQLLVRCPPPPDGYESANPDVREIAALAEKACRKKDFAGLFEAITRSTFAQRRYLAREIALSSPDGSRTVARADFSGLPLRHDGNGYRLATDSDWSTQLEVEFREAKDGSIAVMWFEPYRRSDPAATGSSGHLTFRRAGACWEFTGQTTGNPAESDNP